MVLTLLTAILSACSTRGKEPVASPGVPTTAAPVRLAPPVLWIPGAGEPEPALKQAAATTVGLLATYDKGDGTVAATQARLARAGQPAALADAVGPLLHASSASAADVVYPQLGGLSGDRASVMVVLRQRLLSGSEIRAVSRTLDVRLARQNGGWVAESVASAGGDEVPSPPDLTGPAAQVLGSPAIELPDSARWDVLAGRVDRRVLDLLLALAAEHKLAVTVFATGHPLEVFGTKSTSNHTKGRAVDIWAVDGVPLAQQRQATSPLRALAAGLLSRGVTELGAPWDVDGPGGAGFTNVVHHDHLHLGFDG
ncbi:MAG: hypothetical protein ABIS21_02165 [Acidimicrobiales bacterium]